MADDTHGTAEAAPRLWAKGRRWEDFTVGERFEHHWGRTLWHADNALFSTTTLSWLPLHLNEAYAREQGHETVTLHPLLLFCTVLGMSVEDLSESGGAFLGVDDLRFARPAYPGTTVRARSTVLSKRASGSRPTQGIVTWRTEGVDQDGRLLLEFERTNLILRRDG
ncbi:MaoC family dehydratase [Conexibacter sp. CPCC 206217]|uniref:MaoC family dehydratase n=1 Tax=Conexibacter sp. CPCC 206217 TaxID=3064574 RepID=UPI0027170362|nr:MaoC family dehydratase [Conexibacter sp. CPCC 206217]MDO8212214.1 MaoC family dehydratase [Conexibacter sp. CPCC 206217]